MHIYLLLLMKFCNIYVAILCTINITDISRKCNFKFETNLFLFERSQILVTTAFTDRYISDTMGRYNCVYCS